MRYGTGLIFGGAAAATLALMGLGMRYAPTSSAPQAQTDEPARGPLSGVTVVLDPGHGGADPGTTAGPLSEAALTYRTASELSASLQSDGANVVYTVRSRCLNPTGAPLRSRHSPRPLWARADVARIVWEARLHQDPQAARDVFFVSLHFDQSSVPGVQGGIVCVDRRSASVPKLATALAAQMVEGSLGRSGDFHGVPDLSGRELGVLDPRFNPIPEKVLLEVATLSNPDNAAEAADPAWRSEVVRRITQAITQTHQQTP